VEKFDLVLPSARGNNESTDLRKSKPTTDMPVRHEESKQKLKLDSDKLTEIPVETTENSRINRRRIVKEDQKPEETSLNNNNVDPFAKFDGVNATDLVKKEKKFLVNSDEPPKKDLPKEQATDLKEKKPNRGNIWQDSNTSNTNDNDIPDVTEVKEQKPKRGNMWQDDNTQKQDIPELKTKQMNPSNIWDEKENISSRDDDKVVPFVKQKVVQDDDLNKINKYDNQNQAKPFSEANDSKPVNEDMNKPTGPRMKKKDPEARAKQEQEKQKEMAVKAEQGDNGFFADFDV